MRTVGAVVIRRLPVQQLRVRDQEVQLQPPLITVLNPQHAVLVFIESGIRTRSKARHQLSRCRAVNHFSAKDKTPDVYFLRVGRGVDGSDFFSFPAERWRRRAVVFPQQIIHQLRRRRHRALAGEATRSSSAPLSSTACRGRSRVRHLYGHLARRRPARGRARCHHQR